MLKPISFVFVLAAAAAVSGCTDATLSADGNWSMTLSWGSGTCGLTNPTQVTMTITSAPDGSYLINETGATLTGTVTCDTAMCTVSATEMGTISGAPATLAYNLTLHADNKIDGSGSINVSGSSACSQAFTASGTLQ